jgi:hypothetical protein
MQAVPGWRAAALGERELLVVILLVRGDLVAFDVHHPAAADGDVAAVPCQSARVRGGRDRPRPAAALRVSRRDARGYRALITYCRSVASEAQAIEVWLSASGLRGLPEFDAGVIPVVDAVPPVVAMHPQDGIHLGRPGGVEPLLLALVDLRLQVMTSTEEGILQRSA